MADKIALKRLGSADLTFFEVHYAGRTHGNSNQKAINLNTDVFVDQFYPQAHRLLGAKWPVVLSFFGPGDAGAFSPMPDPRRPITYNNEKNWRLNGGTVHDDPRHPERFRILAPDDLALIRFRGDPAPTEVDVVLISAAVAGDAGAFAALSPLIPGGRRSMISMTPAQLAAVLAGVDLPPGHPLQEGNADPELEAEIDEVARGGQPGPRLGRRRGRVLSRAEMLQAREATDAVGVEGEQLLFEHLSRLETAGDIRNLEWTSLRDAAAPYDFTFEDVASGGQVEIDAKSTRGGFGNSIHLSRAETVQASLAPATYALARIYLIDEDGARLRMAHNIRPFATALIEGLKLPAGVQVDSFKIDPASLDWNEEITILRPKGAAGDE